MRNIKRKEKLRCPLKVKGMKRKIFALEHQVKGLKKKISSKEEKIAHISALQEKHDHALQKSKIEIKKLELTLQIKNHQEDIAISENVVNRLSQAVIADPLDQHAEEGLQIHYSILESRKGRYYNALMDQMRFRLAISKDGINGFSLE